MAKDKKKFIEAIHRFVPFIYTAAVLIFTFYAGIRLRSWGNMVFPFDTSLIVIGLGIYYLVITFATGKRYLVAKTRFLTYLSGITTFVFMYLSMSMLLCDMCLLAVKYFRPELYGKCFFFGFAICFAATFALTLYGIYKKDDIKTVTYKMTQEGMEHYRIILLSDLHTGYYIGEKQLSKIAEKVNELEGNMVVIAGDMINSGNVNECPDIDAAALAIGKFRSQEGTFACTGNHDPDPRDKDFRRFIKKAGINLLSDEVYCNGKFNLAGRSTRTRPRLSIEKIEEKTDKDLPLFIIDHDPMGIDDAIKAKAELVMCGHTHRGQVFPLNLFVRLLYSREEFYGFNKKENTYSAVSSGAGYFSMPMRLGTNSEIVVIDIN